MVDFNYKVNDEIAILEEIVGVSTDSYSYYVQKIKEVDTEKKK